MAICKKFSGNFRVYSIGIPNIAGQNEPDTIKKMPSKPITLKRAESTFEREPLLHSYGFKGGYITRLWQVATLTVTQGVAGPGPVHTAFKKSILKLVMRNMGYFIHIFHSHLTTKSYKPNEKILIVSSVCVNRYCIKKGCVMVYSYN